MAKNSESKLTTFNDGKFVRTAMKQPTPEQLQAVEAFAAENGRKWKERLRDAWINANARIGGEHSHLLQQVRNQFGPLWLDRYILPVDDHGEHWGP